MAENLNEQLDRVRSKASVLVEKYTLLKQSYEESRKEITRLKASLISRESELEKLKTQIEYLSIASTVKMSGEDLETTRAMVADLVREIDRCIADLAE